MRFSSKRDYDAILKLNREIVNDVVDTLVLIHKLQQGLSKTNSYGEAPKKIWFTGVEVPALIKVENKTITEDMMTVNAEQIVAFAFLRDELKARTIYPEEGDVIFWDYQYYEVSNANEVQFFAGRSEYNHSILCETHLTNKNKLQIEKPQR